MRSPTEEQKRKHAPTNYKKKIKKKALAVLLVGEIC
jgi:hypothetical protein